MTYLSSELFISYPTDTFKSENAIRLLDYWHQQRDTRTRPRLSDINLMDLYDIAPYVCIRDVVENGDDFRCRFWGTEMANIYGVECTGKIISESHDESGSRNLLALYRQALSSDVPIRFIGNLGFTRKPKFVSFEGVMMNLDGNDKQKQHIICAIQHAYQMDDEDLAIYQTREQSL